MENDIRILGRLDDSTYRYIPLTPFCLTRARTTLLSVCCLWVINLKTDSSMVLRRWQSANRIMDAVVLLGMRRAKPCRRLDSVVFGVSINRFLAATAIRAAGAGGSTPTEEGGGITRTTISEEPLDFVLPPPSWSLTDLNLARRQDTPAEDNTSSAVLTREEVLSSFPRELSYSASSVCRCLPATPHDPRAARHDTVEQAPAQHQLGWEV